MKKGALTIIALVFLLSSAVGQNLPAAYLSLENSYQNGDIEACLKLEPEILKLDLTRIDTVAANSLSYLGDAHLQLGNLDKALEYFERERPIRQQLTNTDYYGICLYNLAYTFLQKGDYEKASAYAEQLLEVDRKANGESSVQFASSVRKVADIYIEVDRFKDAEKLLQSTIKSQSKNPVRQGDLLSKLGDVYATIGQFSKAQKTLQQALDILFLHAGEQSGEYISAAVNMGTVYMRQGKYPEAEEIFEVAINVMQPDDPEYPTVLNNQALVYQYVGNIERAESLFRKIRMIDSVAVGITHPDYAITLSNLSLALMDAGRFESAEKIMQQALAIQKKNNETNTVSYGRKLNNLGRILLAAGKPEKAIPHFEKSLSIYRKNVGESHHEYATVIYNLGTAQWRAGKGPAGIKNLRTAASIRAKALGKNHPRYAETLQKIAEYQWEQKQIRDAHQTFGEVFENYYHQLDVTFPGLTEEEKSKFYYSKLKDGFEKFNSYAVANAQENPALIQDLYNHHINTKAAIMYATEKVRRSIFASNDSTLIRHFEQWHEQKEQIARAYSQNQDITKVDSLVQAANALEKELTRQSAAFGNQFARRKYSWQDVQKALKPGEGAIEVVRFKVYVPTKGGAFTNNIAYAFVLVAPELKTPTLLLLNNGSDLEGKFMKFYQNSIKFNLEDPYSYKNYFEQIGDLLKKHNITTCYFSPDGVYNQINLNGLLNPFTKKFLLDEYAITFVTNSKELVEKSIKVSQRESVLIGFPKFNLEKDGPIKTVDSKVTRSGNLTRGMRGLLRFVRGDEGITELPGTQKEIQDISKLFSQKPQIYMEKEATEDIAKQVNNPGYLHIATHGYFLEDEGNDEHQKGYFTNPLLKAGLILAGSENFIRDGTPVNEAGDDGILTAYEAMNLRLDNTKLVVLSACETGLGEVKNGEGVYGLQRAFKLAGAQSIVMSLWSVDDAATQELMSTFYSELLKNGEQHAAFRYAQQKIKEKYQKPFYWAAFVMVGI